ncbi:metal-sensitive transcriptional repressor [Clostridium aceticum]|uniref:Metal-sensitive transcriptional repressor n=1 Tax=Clostridium aceticum TaxID=84022 RepID=A0A0G3WCK3_9CLOT|nr:metal-sensing transcriptional repressor [Clostridium aceticum]AKL96058.1 metal-sensitive transcriptional repressor [Clostridium aceticum]
MKKKKVIAQLLKSKENIMNKLNKTLGFLIEEKKPTRLSLEDKEAIIDCLNKIKRQSNDIKSMVENDDDYYNIIKQIEYYRRGLNVAEVLLSKSHSVPLQ